MAKKYLSNLVDKVALICLTDVTGHPDLVMVAACRALDNTATTLRQRLAVAAVIIGAGLVVVINFVVAVWPIVNCIGHEHAVGSCG